MIRTGLLFAAVAMGAGALAAQPEPPIAIARSANNFTFVSGGMIGGPIVKGQPYSAQATTQSTQTLADGNRIVQNSTANLYRDSEGRQRREQSLSNIGPFAASGGDALQIVFISDPVAGVQYSLNSKEQTAVKTTLPPLPPTLPAGAGPGKGIFIQRSVISAEGAGALPPAPMIAGAGMIGMAGPGPITAGMTMAAIGPNVMYMAKNADGSAPSAPNVEQLGTKVIEGVNATGTRTTITIPAGQMGNEKDMAIIDETWYSPELQVLVQSTHTDPRMGTTVYSLTNVSRGEPSPDLFQVPANYMVKEGKADFQIVTKPGQ